MVNTRRRPLGESNLNIIVNGTLVDPYSDVDEVSPAKSAMGTRNK